MTHLERIAADYRTTSLTVGDHPMKAIRSSLPGVWRAADLTEAINGSLVTIAGSVICRQRPGTAKGFVFISLEDETGVANAVVRPDLFERLRLVITQESALTITGKLQSHQGVIHIKAEQIRALARVELPVEASHDFH
jgi:error-prone DNA polymerase